MPCSAAESVPLAVLGTVVRVALQDPRDRAAVERPWHLCVVPPDAAEVSESRVVDFPATGSEFARTAALTSLTQAVTRAAIAEQSGRLLMLHAGALSNLETGATVAYVAPGGTGKTTLTATLGRGRGYVTDETVAVRRSGQIEAYPKPLSVRRTGGGKDEVAPEDLGLQPPGARPWLARLLVVQRDPGHVGEPAITRPGLLDSIVALSPETSALSALDQPLLMCKELLEQVDGLLKVTFREAAQLEEIVSEGLGLERP